MIIYVSAFAVNRLFWLCGEEISCRKSIFLPGYANAVKHAADMHIDMYKMSRQYH